MNKALPLSLKKLASLIFSRPVLPVYLYYCDRQRWGNKYICLVNAMLSKHVQKDGKVLIQYLTNSHWNPILFFIIETYWIICMSTTFLLVSLQAGSQMGSLFSLLESRGNSNWVKQLQGFCCADAVWLPKWPCLPWKLNSGSEQWISDRTAQNSTNVLRNNTEVASLQIASMSLEVVGKRDYSLYLIYHVSALCVMNQY